MQIQAMDTDAFFVEQGDLDAARDIVTTVEHADLFLYGGDQHQLVDPSLPTYDDDAATQLIERVVRFLDAIACAGVNASRDQRYDGGTRRRWSQPAVAQGQANPTSRRSTA